MSKITKAIIPVAGWSTRFLPTVKAYAKHLVPVLDKPQIQLVVEEIVAAGIKDICIVHRPGEKTIRHYFTPNSRLEKYLVKVGKSNLLTDLNKLISEVNFTYISQSPRLPYGNGSPIISAKEFIGNDPFVYAWGDDLTLENTPGRYLSALINTYQQYSPAAVLSVQKFPPEFIHKVGSVRFVDDSKYPNRVDGIFEKLAATDAPSLFGSCSRFVVSPKIVKILEKKQTGRGNELWFTDAVNQLAQTDVVMTVDLGEYGAEYATTGDPQNWFLVNLRLALKDPEFAVKIKSIISHK